MRYLAILLSIYMIMLALMPCQDDADQVSFSYHTTISKSKASTEHNNNENCPPFCACNCCSTAKSITEQPVVMVLVQELNNSYPTYRIPGVQQQSIAIWQPPQIA